MCGAVWNEGALLAGWGGVEGEAEGEGEGEGEGDECEGEVWERQYAEGWGEQ